MRPERYGVFAQTGRDVLELDSCDSHFQEQTLIYRLLCPLLIYTKHVGSHWFYIDLVTIQREQEVISKGKRLYLHSLTETTRALLPFLSEQELMRGNI